MPIRSLTAFWRRCLQPRYFSVVWMETWPSKNCIWFSSPPASRHRRAQVRRRSCGARFSIAALLAQSFTTCQTTLSVTPFPQVLPARQTHRNTRPSLTPADASQESSALLTQSGTGTVRTSAFAGQIHGGPVIVTSLKMCEVQFYRLFPPQAAAKENREKGLSRLPLKRAGIGLLPECLRLIGC